MIIKSVLVVPSVSLQDNSPVTKWPGWPLYSPQTPSSCCWPFAGAQIRRLSATGSGESSRWSLWRSGLALFNTASTSNNSRLWQLCIIHLVESLSLSFLFDAPLCLSSFSFSSVLLLFLCLPALGEGARENQGSVPSDAACFPLTLVILETQKCLSAAWCPNSEFWMPSEPDCVRSLSRLHA